MLSHPTSFPSNFRIWRPTIYTNLLIYELRATGPFIPPFAWILTLFSSTLLWKWCTSLWKGTSNPSGDSHWHSVWGLGGNPHPSRVLQMPSLWNAAVSYGGCGDSCLWPWLPSCARRECGFARPIVAKVLLRCVQQENPVVDESWTVGRPLRF